MSTALFIGEEGEYAFILELGGWTVVARALNLYRNNADTPDHDRVVANNLLAEMRKAGE